jgi:Zn-dependent peptidase ImmA (M78 family)
MNKLGSEQEARQLLKRVGYAIPVDVFGIAEQCGVSVRAVELEELVSGMLVIKGDRAVIGVNAHDHQHRQRFTVAHELGHFFLHRESSDLFVDGSTVFYRDEKSSEGVWLREVEANAFAASLLMPREALRKQLSAQRLDFLDDVAIRELADRYVVSMQAMTIRLSRLNLLTA